VHWYGDVVAGGLVWAAAVARLHANEQFLAAMDAARSDVEHMRRQGSPPQAECAVDAGALVIAI